MQIEEKRCPMPYKKISMVVIPALLATALLYSGCAPVDVNQLIAGGQLNQAQLLCEKQAGAERKDCFRRVSQAHLEARNLDLAVQCHIKANEEVVLAEGFVDNHNSWHDNNNAEVSQGVQNGRYLFEHKREKNTWYAWPQTQVDLNGADDFRIEAEMTKIAGIDDHRYELVWGLRNTENNFTFGISGNGSYRYGKNKDGNWIGLCEWTPSSSIHKYNAKNVLAVEKKGTLLRFFINGQQVLEKPFEPGFGSRVGFCLNQKMKVAVHHLTVTRYPSERMAYRTILDGRLAAGDVITYINNCDKAGYSKNEAYVRVAEFHLAKGELEAANINLERAGWSVRALDNRVLFDEQFVDNKNKWFEKDDAEVVEKVQNGRYLFTEKKEKEVRYSWPQTAVIIDASGDFRLESTMTKISGVENNTYGLFWGSTDGWNCYCFGIDGLGSYKYGKYEQNHWQTIIDWTPSAYINKGNLTNSLVVEKIGDIVRFSLNDHVVAEKPYEKHAGQQIGFFLDDQMTVEFANFTVLQLPPRMARALAAQYAPKESAVEGGKEGSKNGRKESAPMETSTKL